MYATVDRIIRCLAKNDCNGIETMSMCARIWLAKLFDIHFDSCDRCPVCGKMYKRLYAHYLRSRCRFTLENLLRPFIDVYRMRKEMCTQYEDIIYCRICRRSFDSMRDCLLHLFEEHIDILTPRSDLEGGWVR